MKIFITTLLFITLFSTIVLASEAEERELGIQLIEIDSIPMADEQLKLKLPDYHQETLAKEIEINEQYHHENLKYDYRDIRTDL